MEAVFGHPLFAPLLIIAVILLAFPLVAGYVVLLERKVLADMQVRLGPMRVGPFGFLQPIADALKLLLKEDIVPAAADRWIFLMAPVISMFTAFTAFAVVPFSHNVYITDVNVGCWSYRRWAPWVSSGSSLADGPRTVTTRCLARCGRPHSLSAMKWPSRSRC